MSDGPHPSLLTSLRVALRHRPPLELGFEGHVGSRPAACLPQGVHEGHEVGVAFTTDLEQKPIQTAQPVTLEHRRRSKPALDLSLIEWPIRLDLDESKEGATNRRGVHASVIPCDEPGSLKPPHSLESSGGGEAYGLANLLIGDLSICLNEPQDPAVHAVENHDKTIYCLGARLQTLDSCSTTQS